MKKFLIAALLTAPVIALFGCQQDASVQGDIANLKSQVAQLQDQNNRLREDLANRPAAEAGDNGDVGTLLARLERQERALNEADKRIAELEKKPADVPAEKKADDEKTKDEVSADFSDAEYEKFKAMQAKEREARNAERKKQRDAQMQKWAKLAKDNGLDFDPKDPRGSIMKIMGDPEQRAKAFKVMKSEMDKRRLEPLKLDDYQTGEVLRIEEETRNKISDVMKNARETGATQEDIQAQVKQIKDDEEGQLGGVLSPDQMKQYKDSGAQTGGLIDPGNMGGLGGLGGLIPGMGGGGRGWGGGGNGR